MRIHIKCSNNTSPVSFNHQHLLTGSIHKWLGKNDEHGELSLYSFSMLSNGKVVNNNLEFTEGTNFFISAYDNNIQKRLINGIQGSPNLFNGISVQEIIIQETPDFSKQEFFKVSSPVLIKKRIEDNIKHITYENQQSGEFLTESLKTKMQAVGLIDDSLEISFIKDYKGAKTRLLSYRDVKNKASWCPVMIKGKPETKAFAWNVGIGNSTGIGFGSLK